MVVRGHVRVQHRRHQATRAVLHPPGAVKRRVERHQEVPVLNTQIRTVKKCQCQRVNKSQSRVRELRTGELQSHIKRDINGLKVEAGKKYQTFFHDFKESNGRGEHFGEACDNQLEGLGIPNLILRICRCSHFRRNPASDVCGKRDNSLLLDPLYWEGGLKLIVYSHQTFEISQKKSYLKLITDYITTYLTTTSCFLCWIYHKSTKIVFFFVQQILAFKI